MAKVVMVRSGDWFAMVALPAPARLDLDAVASITGRTPLRLAIEGEFADFFPECEPGAMPPFGHLYGIDLFLDRDLADADEIVFPAGRHEEEVRMWSWRLTSHRRPAAKRVRTSSLIQRQRIA